MGQGVIMTDPKYLCVKEVASILRVKLSTLYKYVDEVPGHFLAFGKVHRFHADQFFEGYKQKAQKKTTSKRRKGYNDNRHNL